MRKHDPFDLLGGDPLFHTRRGQRPALQESVSERPASQVRGHDEEDLLAAVPGAATVHQVSLVKGWEEEVHHLFMCLLDLVQKDHRTTSAPLVQALQEASQGAALARISVATWSANQCGDISLGLEGRHINAEHMLLGPEDADRQRLCQLSLPNPCRANKEEGPEGTSRLAQAHVAHLHDVRDQGHGGVLPDHELGEHLRQGDDARPGLPRLAPHCLRRLAKRHCITVLLLFLRLHLPPPLVQVLLCQ
mmetsp:Transcript_10211/g.30712  ORF Transcript_10211/g.30712 Transcript_10211/m.30712 type:complete len:248 (+) Transcript_10211:653-1396(+)